MTENKTNSSFVSVKFDRVGRIHRFLLAGVKFKPPLEPGDDVIVQRNEKRLYATVTRTIPQIAERSVSGAKNSLKMIRRASQKDVQNRLKQQYREREAKRVAAIKIKEHGLPMKLVRVEQQFDGPRLVFSFTADGRIDFRGLVRDLANEFSCRIEMRQVGARDEAKILGGYGTCGRPLCCTTWLPKFEPISIKMAKNQNLSLNPSRLSGLCGRLKCCLRYELPNAAGEQFAGCANEGDCSRSAGGCGADGDGCGSGACDGCDAGCH